MQRIVFAANIGVAIAVVGLGAWWLGYLIGAWSQ